MEGILILLCLTSIASGGTLYDLPSRGPDSNDLPITGAREFHEFSSGSPKSDSLTRGAVVADHEFSGVNQSSGRAGGTGSGVTLPRDAIVPISGALINPSLNLNYVEAAGVDQYEDHVLPRVGSVPVTRTITNEVTKTHTLRIPSTSDVWVTSVKMVSVYVTQLSTLRSYVPGVADTVTSFIRITKTPITIVTRTAEVYPTKTVVSVFTRFVTQIQTVELWQPIVHRAISYEVMTIPVVETQTLLQRLFTTVTLTSTVDVTSVRLPHEFPAVGRGGFVPATEVPHHHHHYGQ